MAACKKTEISMVLSYTNKVVTINKHVRGHMLDKPSIQPACGCVGLSFLGGGGIKKHTNHL